MPREVKKRGRRAAAKRAEEEQDDVDLKVYENDEDYVTFDNEGGVAGGQDEENDGYDNETPYNPLDLKQMPFFGFLDDQEAEYFKTAESTLAVDAFGSPEEKLGFISGLLDEARGKELKLVTNQICSKLMERLILLANDEQIRALFEVFAGYFVDLSRHKFSSHCVETLLVRGAALVEKEVLDPNFDGDSEESMEKRFLTLANDMKDYIQDLISNPYASHVIRVLLLILGGQTLPSPTSSEGNSSVLRSKKSRTARRNIEIKDAEDERAYQIPGKFHDALETIVTGFNGRLKPTAARELAIGQVSSPVVQLLIDSEATTSESRPLLNTIFADTEDRDSSEEAFVEHLLSDAVGSHFLQNVLQKAPEAFVERLYRLYMSQRVQKLVRRDYAGFVIETCMQRLPEEDVHHIIDTAIGEIPYLVENNNLSMVRILLTRAAAANYKATEVADAVLKTFNTDSTDPRLLQKVLQLDEKNPYKPHEASSTGLHRCLVLQQLVEASPDVLAQAFMGLNSGDVDIIKMAKHQSYSRLLEKLLRPSINTIERRKFLNKINGQCVDLARDPFASHVMDRLWNFSYKMNNFREKIANELVADDDLKENTYGKAVWRNWSLDKFLRRKSDWWVILHSTDDALAKEYEELGTPLDAKSLAQAGTKRFGRGGARVITRGGGIAPRGGRGRGGYRGGRGNHRGGFGGSDRGGFGGSDRGGFNKRSNGDGEESSGDRSRKKVRNE